MRAIGRFVVVSLALASVVVMTGPPASAETDVLVAPVAVTDQTAPTIVLTTPKAGASYAHNAVVKASYSCKDVGGSRLASCTGTFPNGSNLPTQTLGAKSFKVIASDGAGNITKREITYFVVDKTKPSVSISTPSDGATYNKNQVINADFSCNDEPAGSDIASCVGTVADGAAVNTSSVGTKTFKVTATDNAGNKTTKTVRYRVVNA